MSRRLRDFALLLGHAWRCSDCREALLAQPLNATVGFKLDEEQRECVLKLSDESFQTVMRLADASGLTTRELEEAIDHPRARLRHLGSLRNHSYITGG
ncbi:MAG: hypothetical protein R3C14_37665 [Caldilineaceae bacterium]